jgi:hypothetical protein
MDHLNIVKQAVEVAFSCGKISKLEDIRLILISLDIIEEKLKPAAQPAAAGPIMQYDNIK